MQVKRAKLVESLQIVADADADRLTSRAGTALLSGLADRVGLTGALSQAMGGVRKRRSRHDPGRTLRDLAVMIADGGDCLADLRALRDQPALFLAMLPPMRPAGGRWRRSTGIGWRRCGGHGRRRGRVSGSWPGRPSGWCSTSTRRS